MSTEADIDTALEAVVAAARHHRAVLRAGAGEERVWQAYVALNNATVRYDDLISEVYDEVTPWDCEYLAGNGDEQTGPDGAPIVHHPDAPHIGGLDRDPELELSLGAGGRGPVGPVTGADHEGVAMGLSVPAAGLGPGIDAGPTGEPGALVCVRHRRDYVVAEPGRLLALATEARRASWAAVDPEHADRPVSGLGEAINELVQAGDGTVGALDAYPDELIPGNGVLVINAVRRPLTFGDPVAADDGDPAGDQPFRLGPDEIQLYRMEEEVVDEDGLDEADALRR